MSQLSIVTVANRVPSAWYFFYPQFFESCRKFGHEPIVLGREPGEYMGLGSKPKLLKRAIERGQIKSEWLLFCDCFDLVFARDPSLCIEIMADLYPKAQMVIGAEKNSYPQPEWAPLYPEVKSSFRYVNSGFMLARTEDFLKFLVELNPERILNDGDVDEHLCIVSPNDQEFVAETFLHGKAINVQLDTEAALVVNLCGLIPDEIDFTGELPKVVETGTSPVAYHANGGGKEGWHGPVLKALGYLP